MYAEQRGKRGRPDACLCYICSRLVGSTVMCSVCHSMSVHRKCGAVTGSLWTCPECAQEGVPIKKEDDREPGEVEEQIPSKPLKIEPVLVPRQTRAVPVLPGMTCFCIPPERLHPDTVFRQISAEAKSDEALFALLAQKQTEYQSLIADFEGRKLELHNAKLGDQEHRMALFRLQEMHIHTLSRLKEEVIDRLQAARLFGFEGIKQLKGDSMIPDPPYKELEAYRLAQRTVVERLLTCDFQQRSKHYSIPRKEAGKGKVKKEVRSMASVLLNPASHNSAFALLAKAIREVKTRSCEAEEDEFTLSMLSAIVKGAFDGCLSTCQGFHGCSTDPELLHELFVKIRHKY